ncbi:hypothetical protein [Reichenbachiella versicolor]|uniref:hypothetical protein n=1 Tax=Reichenbachiella versicolor TaxID=1821036 RepID=UPI000D6E4251|nr:hypothetical protein [Reichenbachiella versicolor]
MSDLESDKGKQLPKEEVTSNIEEAKSTNKYNWNAISAISACISTLLAFGALITTIWLTSSQLESSKLQFETQLKQNEEFLEKELLLLRQQFEQEMSFNNLMFDTTVYITRQQIVQTEEIAKEEVKLFLQEMDLNKDQFEASFELTKSQADLARDVVFGVVEKDQLRELVVLDLKDRIIPGIEDMKYFYQAYKSFLEDDRRTKDKSIPTKPDGQLIKGISPLDMHEVFQKKVIDIQSVYYSVDQLPSAENLIQTSKEISKSKKEEEIKLKGKLIDNRNYWFSNRQRNQHNREVLEDIKHIADSSAKVELHKLLDIYVSACDDIVKDSYTLVEFYEAQQVDSISVNEDVVTK